jgi:hypothetical protein
MWIRLRIHFLIFTLTFFLLLALCLLFRYYRANSVRFPTQVCESVCTLNHYCSITRIDYREHRQCFEAGTSALQGNGSIRRDMNNKILLLLIAFIQLLLHQHVAAAQIVLGAIHVKLSIVKAFKSLVAPVRATHLQLEHGC